MIRTFKKTWSIRHTRGPKMLGISPSLFSVIHCQFILYKTGSFRAYYSWASYNIPMLKHLYFPVRLGIPLLAADPARDLLTAGDLSRDPVPIPLGNVLLLTPPGDLSLPPPPTGDLSLDNSGNFNRSLPFSGLLWLAASFSFLASLSWVERFLNF